MNVKTSIAVARLTRIGSSDRFRVYSMSNEHLGVIERHDDGSYTTSTRVEPFAKLAQAVTHLQREAA